jgi:sister chromatid cohesion protein DCC1
MSTLDLKFCNNPTDDSGSFRLLELPPELCQLIESSANTRRVHVTLPHCVKLISDDDLCRLTIRGQADEDAVLCTTEKTYALRSVVLSNSVLVVTPTSNAKEVVIRDQLHEILEPVPCLPKLHKLASLLRGREYDDGHEGEDDLSDDNHDRPVSSHLA